MKTLPQAYLPLKEKASQTDHEMVFEEYKEMTSLSDQTSGLLIQCADRECGKRHKIWRKDAWQRSHSKLSDHLKEV